MATFAGNTARFLVALLGLMVVPVLGFFFLKDFPVILEKAQRLLPRKFEKLLVQRFSQVDGVLSAFIRGQLAVGTILSAVYSVGLSAARVDMAIFIALVSGFGNMVPYVGTGVGIALASVGLILNWHGMWQVAVVALTFILGQMLESLVITPRIVGSKVGLPPVVV